MTYQFKNASILVVDDMQPMLALTVSLLKIFGFTNIITATDAEDAFRKFVMQNPDLVITDWQMEPYDGTVLAKKIRTDAKSPNRFVPIIMMTGYSHMIRVVQARDCGVTEFLVKPYRSKDLYSRIEQLIEKPRTFVDAQSFFGPDRRRRKPDNYAGPFRRQADSAPVEEEDSSSLEKGDRAMLRDLKKMAKSAASKDLDKDRK